MNTLSPKTGLFLVILVALAFALPSLDMGFFLDDYAQLALMESWYPTQAGLFDLYSFLGELPLQDPWWKHPEFKVSMWRPLSSALLRVDNIFFGHQAIWYHAHSLLWFAAMLGACALLYRRLLPSRVALLALLIFGLDECQTLTAGWIANRYAMVAMTSSVLGLLCHLRWRQENWRPGLPLSIAGYIVGLLAGEVALGVMAYVVAFELFPLRRPHRGQLLGLAPACIVGLAYATLYKLGGFGAANSGFYLDPTGETVAFLKGAAGHIPTLLAGALAGLPSDLWFFAPAIRPVQIATGTVAILVFAGLLKWLWSDFAERLRDALTWLLPGAAFALLPAAVPQPFDRVLITPMLGLAVALAALLDLALRRLGNRECRPSARLASGAAITILVAIHLLVVPAAKVASQRFMAREWRELPRLADRIPIPDSTDTRVVLPVAPDIVIAGFLPLMHGFLGHSPFQSWTALSLAPYDHRLTRVGPRTLELEVLEGEFLTSPPERFHRYATSRMQEGDRATTPLFAAEIKTTNDLGPTRVVFYFELDLDEDFTFLAWKAGTLQQIELPPVGSALVIPYAPGPMAAALEDVSLF